MHWRMKALGLAAAVALGAGVAVGSDLSGQLRDSQARQEQLRTEARQVADQLDAVIAQYHKNGLDGGTEVKTLRQIRAVLATLSDQDMRQVIQYLDAARQQEGDAALHTAAEAHAGQAAIVARLQALLRASQRQQALEELASRFAQLAERQSANLGNIVEIVRKIGIHVEPRTLDRKDVRDALKVQQDQQDLLNTDVTAALGDLAAFADAPDPSDAKRVQQAMELSKSNKLSDAVGGAATSLGAGELGLAATDEKTTRDTLVAISHALAEPLDRVGQLKKSAQEIDQEIAEQKRLADATAAAAKRTDQAKDLRKADPSGVRAGQADLVDKTDQMRKDLEKLAPAAADALHQATDHMQQARSSLNGDHKDPALRAQQSALQRLAEARQAVQQQLNREQSPAPPKDTLAALQDLKQQTHELKQKQEALKDQTAAAHDAPARQAQADAQNGLRQKAEDLQQQAADRAPDAAKAMADGAHQMDKAGQSLQDARHDPASTAQAQQSAADDLGRAEQQLDQNIANATDEAKQEQQALAAREQLAKAIEGQQQVGQQTAAAANKPEQARAQQSKQAGTQQKQVAGDTDHVKAQLPGAAKAAAAPLDEAKKKMDAAAAKLDEPNPTAAQPAEKDAQADLYQAKRQLDSAIDKMDADLGHPPDPAKDLADLARQLDQAQKQLADAQGQLAQAAPKPNDAKQANAQQQMKALAQKVGEMAAHSPAGAPDAAQQGMQQAQEHLGDAAGQTEAQNPAAAQQSASQAQQALAQAQAAVAMAQSGMAQGGQPAPGAPAPGQGQSSAQAQAGGPSSGNPSPGSADENNPANGGGNRTDTNGGVTDAGPRKDVHSAGKFVGLPPRDRQALEQSQAGKYPQAYGPEVEQYLRNLSDNASDAASDDRK